MKSPNDEEIFLCRQVLILSDLETSYHIQSARSSLIDDTDYSLIGDSCRWRGVFLECVRFFQV